MEMTEEECKRMLEVVLEDGLYEIELGGYRALIGRDGYIDYLLRGIRIDRIVMEINNDKNMTNL